MKIMVVLILVGSVAACGDNMPPPDDGFGVPCNVSFDGRLFTTCRSLLGEEGLCVQLLTGDPAGVCRRWCNGDNNTCPADQAAIPTVGNRCFCEP